MMTFSLQVVCIDCDEPAEPGKNRCAAHLRRTTGTQGIPDDLKRSDDLPVDVAGAADAIYVRLCMLQEELARVHGALLDLRDAVKADGVRRSRA